MDSEQCADQQASIMKLKEEAAAAALAADLDRALHDLRLLAVKKKKEILEKDLHRLEQTELFRF